MEKKQIKTIADIEGLMLEIAEFTTFNKKTSQYKGVLICVEVDNEVHQNLVKELSSINSDISDFPFGRNSFKCHDFKITTQFGTCLIKTVS